MIVVTEENKDQINSALTAKLLDFDINIPSLLNDIKLLNLDNLNGASADVSNKLNVDTWFNNTIACMDISAGCQGCNTSQTDFGECTSGCQGINTGCNDCQGTDAVPVCTSCNNGETCEQQPTVIEVCTSCDEGCFVCNEPCFRCDGGCQGAQTCHSCNNGEGCTSGCQNNFQEGCKDCQIDYTPCATGYVPPCNRSQANYGCPSCDTGCQGNDICSGYSACTTCVSCDRGNTCTAGNQFIESGGCTSGNSKGCIMFFGGTCKVGYTTNRDTGNATCVNTFSLNGMSCTANFKMTGSGGVFSCPSGYTDTEANIKCSMNYSSDGYCQTGYSAGSISCQGYFDPSMTTGSGNGLACTRNFAVGTNIGCEYKYNSVGNSTDCPSNYTTAGGASKCKLDFKSSERGTSCPSGYNGVGIKCEKGYSTTPDGDPICVSVYSTPEDDCPSNYGNTCSACNVGSNNTCVSCVNGQAAQCTRCFGNGNEANCQSVCVLGQADTCDAGCVTVGNGGCSDCQGCDSGCNENVSCDSTFRYDENGKIDCKVTYTDTSCSQICVNGFNSNTDCFQCVTCDSECESCEGNCQGGCQSCESGCQTYCESVCQDCQGGCDTTCVGCDSTCDSSCFSGCDTCDGTCDITCQGCQDECIDGVGECSTADGCASGQSQCAGAWCGTSQDCEGGY